MTHKIIFFGGVGNPDAFGGELTKNKEIIARLNDLGYSLTVIDCHRARHKLRTLFSVLFTFFIQIILHPRATVIFSTSMRNVYTLVRLLNYWPARLHIVYWAIGGNLSDRIESGYYKKEHLRCVSLFLVEGLKMKKQMDSLGFNNVLHVPNFKTIGEVPERHKVEDGKKHFVFLSRILPDKGCDDILQSCATLNKKGYENCFVIDFYGVIDDDYRTRFEETVAQFNNVNYRGCLHLQKEKNYSVLAKYHYMLFPTYWRGEGFPGVAIDAYKAGVPIIGSDWNFNSEFIKDGVTGILIPTHSVDGLAGAMERVLSGEFEYDIMAKNCQREVWAYDTSHVISPALGEIICCRSSGRGGYERLKHGKLIFFFRKIKKYLTETVKYMLRSYPVIRPYIREVESLYEMDADQLRARNEKRFLSIFRRAYDKSPFYNRLYTEAGIKKEDITSLDDIKKLPVVTKEMVKQHADEMLTVPRWQVIAAHTSGTTGTPLTIYEDWPSIWRAQAYIYCSRKRNGFLIGQRLVSLRGNLDRSLNFLKIHISNTLYLSSYNINKQTIHIYYELIVKHNPVAIEGYPSSLYSLSLCLKEARLKLHIPVTFTSSETLLDSQRKLIKCQLGTEIYDRYGMTERTIYLLEKNNHEGYYEAPGYSINEYVEDGEICTSLINSAFPMIRYRSYDVIERGEERNGSPFMIKRIEGRKEDFLFCKDGSRIMRLDFLFKDIAHVRMSQLVQNKDGVLDINIVPEPEFTDLDKTQIEYNLLQRVGRGNIDYRINIIAECDLRYTANGKFKYLINSMSNNV